MGVFRDMLYDLLPDEVKQYPKYMDFAGQRRAERTFQVIITLFAVVGFVWGYICQQFSQTMYIMFAGFILAAALTLPPWPMYRRNPLPWQPTKNRGEAVPMVTQSPARHSNKPHKRRR